MAKRIAACIAIAIFVMVSLSAHAGYRRELKKATEKGSFYHFTDWNAELIWHATFFSDNFRKAFTKQHEKLRYLSRPEVDSYIAEQEMRHDEGWEFFVGIYTKKPYKKFTNYEDSFWKIYLITDSGERISPTSVDHVQITPYEKEMFPYLDRWSKAYLVVFPKIDLGEKFELQMDSVVGHSTLDFKVK